MTAELKFRELEFTTTASLSANDALVRRLEEEVKERVGHLKRLEDDLRAEHQQCLRLEQQLQQQQQTYEQHRQLQTLERQDQRIQQLQEQSRSQSHVRHRSVYSRVGLIWTIHISQMALLVHRCPLLGRCRSTILRRLIVKY